MEGPSGTYVLKRRFRRIDSCERNRNSFATRFLEAARAGLATCYCTVELDFVVIKGKLQLITSYQLSAVVFARIYGLDYPLFTQRH